MELLREKEISQMLIEEIFNLLTPENKRIILAEAERLKASQQESVKQPCSPL